MNYMITGVGLMIVAQTNVSELDTMGGVCCFLGWVLFIVGTFQKDKK